MAICRICQNVHMDEICTGNEAIHWNVFRELGLISNYIIMCAMDWNVFGNELLQ